MKVRGKNLLGASALALALAISGCGDKASTDGESGTGGGSADAGGASAQQFTPRVAQDAVMAVGLNLDKDVYYLS